MNTELHPVSPEDIMAFLDTETFGKEALRVEKHMRQCTECTALAARLRSTSRTLDEWTVPPIPQHIENAVLAAAGNASRTAPETRRTTPLTFSNWRLWTIGGSSAAVAVLGLIAVVTFVEHRHRSDVYPAPMEQTASQAETRSASIGGAVAQVDSLKAAPPPPPSTSEFSSANDATAAAPQTGPMIARTVSLGILVKDYAPARTALDAILARHRGYAASLTLNTPENDARTFSASLRVPASELDATLRELRQLGRVQSETQSGEEVTQQHADLAARLHNARETETRLLAILQQRTGKVDEVLDVEEKLSAVRGEIETMEAEQQELEHRVSFASIDLQITEEYRAQLGTHTQPVSTRMHNAFIAGLGRASATLLSLVLFFEEFGPAMLIWLAIVVVPAGILWRRYRRALLRA